MAKSPLALTARAETWLDRHRWIYPLCFAIFYLWLTCARAAAKPLWFDEFFTVYISRLPHFSDIWRALEGGGDANPPLNYWLTRGAFALLGQGPVSSRLPAILGFLAMSICIFRFVAKRAPAAYAAAAMLFPTATLAYSYADEGRPYGLALGFAGLVLVFWQQAAETNRPWPLAGLTLSIAGAAWTHYYATFIVMPIVLGELFRTWHKKRLFVSVWLAIGLGLAPVALLAPLIRGANSNVFAKPLTSPHFWAKPGLTSLLDTYSAFLMPALPILVAAFILWAVAATLPIHPEPAAPAIAGLQPHEMAAAIGFLAIPVALTVFTRIFMGYYMDRYALTTIAGFAIVFGLLAVSQFQKPVYGLALVLLLTGNFALTRGWKLLGPPAEAHQGIAADPIFDATKAGGLRIAVANPLNYVQTAYYGPGDLTRRMVYLSCPQVAVQYPDFVPELAVLSLRKWAPVQVEDYHAFLSAHPRFWVYYTSLDRVEWLVPQLVKDGRTVQLRAQNAGHMLFEVSTSTAPLP